MPALRTATRKTARNPDSSRGVARGRNRSGFASLRDRIWRRPPVPTALRRTFIDDDNQSAFERDGYVVVDLLDAGQVAELRAAYARLDHRHQDDSPWVDGFETSLYDPRPTYRAAVLDDVERVMRDPLKRFVDDHEIMFANYVVKLPSSAAVPPHADWTFLDEDRYRSATVWSPLADTSVALSNGALGLAVGSQERIDFLRIANVPCYDRCVEAVEDLPRAVPSLKAGQAIIMDNRVVHFSAPNETDDTRVAVGCVIGPTEAELRHYWLDDHNQLLRFTIDRTFYLSYEIGRPLGTDGIRTVDVTGYEAFSPAP